MYKGKFFKYLENFKTQPLWLKVIFFAGLFSDLITATSYFYLFKSSVTNIMNKLITEEAREIINPADLQNLESNVALISIVFLIVFLAWDIIAYLMLPLKRMWARTFILSIALCGIVLFIAEKIATYRGFDLPGSSLKFELLSLPFYLFSAFMLIKNKKYFS